MNLGKTTIFTPSQLRLQALLLLEDNSLVMPLFDYADLVWGDKHNVTLTTSLQDLLDKAAKIILDRPLYSSATHALATLKWVPLEKKAFS